MELEIISIRRTSFFAFAQWECKLKDGRMLYIRERHDNLTISISPEETDDIFDAVRGECLLSVKATIMEINDVLEIAKENGLILKMAHP